MGNSNRSSLTFSSYCYEDNVSRDSVTVEYWDSHGIHDDYRVTSIFTAVFILLLMLIGLPANAIIIVSIIKEKLFKETTHILLLNLVISDFLLCLLVMPFTVVAGFAGGYVFGSSDFTRCQVCLQTGVILTFSSVLSLNIIGLISLDRFIFIKFPLYYEKLVTVPRVIVIIILTWLLSITEAFPPAVGFGEIKYGYSMSSCFINFFTKLKNGIYYGLLVIFLNLIPIVITIVTNIWIACIARKQIRTVYGTQTSISSEHDSDKAMQRRAKRKIMKKQLILIRVFGVIILANIIVWLPVIFLSLIFQAIKKTSIPLGFYVYIYASLVMHAVLHPLIEGCFIPQIKTAFCEVIRLHHCQTQCLSNEQGNQEQYTTNS